MAKKYKTDKLLFDNKAFIYMMKRVFDDISETDACNLNIIDSLGNVLKKVPSNDGWSFTMLDQFILLIKKTFGEDKLKKLLSNFEYVKYIDPMFIINMDKNVNLHNVKKGFDKIITMVNDKEFLPSNTFHKDPFIDLDNESMNYCDYLSRALTVLTFLIYGIRLDRVPTSIEFDNDVLPSVEETFNVRSIGTYNEIKQYCEDCKLIEFSKTSKLGIQLCIKAAKVFVNDKLMNYTVKRFENQSKNWEKLSGVHND